MATALRRILLWCSLWVVLEIGENITVPQGIASSFGALAVGRLWCLQIFSILRPYSIQSALTMVELAFIHNDFVVCFAATFPFSSISERFVEPAARR